MPWYDMIYHAVMWCDVRAIAVLMFFLLIHYLHFYYFDLLILFVYYLTLMLLLILHGQRYREGITKMQESSHSFDHHNQLPLKSKRRAVATALTAADQVLKDSRAAATATATGNKEIVLWAPDSIKLPDIRHFKKSARTIRRPIKGLHSTSMSSIYFYLFLSIKPLITPHDIHISFSEPE